MKKRKWVYIMKPTAYEISCDLCGGSNIEWSEFEHMIWCYDCEKDTPGNEGIFDGPIPVEVCKMLGISFDKINLKTKTRRYMKVCKDGHLRWYKKMANKAMHSTCSAGV